MCGVKESYLGTYIGRGQIILTRRKGKEYIDDTKWPNLMFFQKRMGNTAKYAVNPIVSEEPTQIVIEHNNNAVESVKPQVKEPDIEEYIRPKAIPTHSQSSQALNNFSSIATRKEQLAIAKMEEELRKLKLGNSKTQGNFVDIEAVKSVIVLLSESINTAWEIGLDNFIMKFSSKNKLSRDEILEMKKDINGTSNVAKEAAINNAKKQIRNLQSESANKRGVGERF